MKVESIKKYTPETANRVRELLIQLSRSGKDRGEIPEEWFNDLINSPYHDMLLAIDENAENKDCEDGKIVGIATLSVIMGPIIRKNAYLEDFVTDETYRGQGVGSMLWNAMLMWAKAKGCQELNFTSGKGREAAWKFYENRGAEIYDTNFFKKAI
jgi:GNAT superfamily N-acetyltransferase